MVVANMLQTRKQEVIMVTKENDYLISLTEDEMNHGEEIEKLIVSDLVKKHAQFVTNANERRWYQQKY